MGKNWGAATALFALLALISLAAWFDVSAPYRHCNGADGCNQTANNDNKPVDYMVPVRVFGAFLDTRRDAANAISTFVIAVFTVVLAWRTGGLSGRLWRPLAPEMPSSRFVKEECASMNLGVSGRRFRGTSASLASASIFWRPKSRLKNCSPLRGFIWWRPPATRASSSAGSAAFR